MSLTVTLVIEIALFLFVVAGSVWGAGKYFNNKFNELKTQQTADHHTVQLQLTEIKTTVSPYATDIAQLKTQQQENMLKIAELSNFRADIDRHERMITAMQNR